MEWEASMRRAFGITIFAVLVAASVASSISGTMEGLAAYKEQRVLATTVQMERLAKKLERGKRIIPETKIELTRLTLEPWSDCTQTGCRKTLEVRNRAARENLQTAISRSRLPDEP
jgi:hypothetical protein